MFFLPRHRQTHLNAVNDPCHQPDEQIDRALGQDWPAKDDFGGKIFRSSQEADEFAAKKFMPVEGVNGFTLLGSPESLVDAALQVYARALYYPDSRHLHEAAMAYRAELIRIVAIAALHRAKGGE